MRIHLLAIAVLATFGLAACQQTASNSGPATSNMAGNIAEGQGASAQSVQTASVNPALINGKSSCEEIQAAIQQIDANIRPASGIGSATYNSQLATSAVTHGALYSGALGNVPFLGAGLSLFNGASAARAAAVDANNANMDDERRRLMGIYEGKGC